MQRWLAVAALGLALLAPTGQAVASGQDKAAAPPALIPYKDVSLAIADPVLPRIATAVAGGPPQVLPGARPGQQAGRADTLIWAFATGECGDERWGPFDTARFAQLNVAAHVVAGAGYIIATGGEAGIFTCGSRSGMARFMARYDSPQLRGFDFDIEGKQTEAQIADLMARIREGQQWRPGLRWSVTLATHAAEDGSRQSLNATGERVLRAAREAGVASLIINLMVMNYGPAEARFCVRQTQSEPPRCDMGASALQAVRNVAARHGLPIQRFAVTPMLGRNDVADNRLSLADAERLARDARAAGLDAVHYWSLDRDRSCAGDADALSPTCHGLPGLAPGAFAQALARGLGAADGPPHRRRPMPPATGVGR